MSCISVPRRLTSTWPDVGFFKLNGEPADVDRVPVAREVAEDRGPFRGFRDGRRAARGGSSAGTRAGAFGGVVSRIFRTFIMRRLRFPIAAVDRVAAYSCSIWRTTLFRRCAVVARPPG